MRHDAPNPRGPHKRSALTLVELLVVLVILAVVTVIAVQSTDYLVDQGRFDATQRTLQNLQNAVLGPPNQTQADGTQAASGFLADMGRLPIADANGTPSELWTGALPAYGPLYPEQANYVAAPGSGDTDYRNVCVLAGWRGPYMRLAANQLTDGWGNPFLFRKSLAGADVPAAGDLIAGVQVAPNLALSDAYTATLAAQPTTILTNNAAGLATTIMGTIVDTDATNTPATNPVSVKLFYVDFANSTTMLTVLDPVDNSGNSVTSLATPYSFKFTPMLKAVNGVSVPATGNMVLRVHQTVGATTRSAIVRIRVPVGGLTQNISFDIQ